MARASLLPLGLVLVTVAFVPLACDKTSPPPGDSATSPADGGASAADTKTTDTKTTDTKTADPAPGDTKTADPTPADPPPAEARRATVPSAHPLHARFEGTDFPNDCKADPECHAAGCSKEVCSADEGVMTMCDVPLVSLPEGTQCGCVQGQCQWWNSTGATLPIPDTKGSPPPSEPTAPPSSKPPSPKPPKGDCGGKVCKAPQTCIEYYGIAGKRGPKFQSCEIRCTPGKGGCPSGTKCANVADGPGNVCR